jgi:hypothetical protein
MGLRSFLKMMMYPALGADLAWAGAVRFANAHLSDDEAVAKMGHPDYLRHPDFLN